MDMPLRCSFNYLFSGFLSLALFLALPANASEGIDIVGSSTVYPFSTVAAERFSQITGGRSPKVESTGSGGGLALFCAGYGERTPDITNASRRIKKSEQKLCAKNGVSKVLEVKIGYDGIAIAQSIQGAVFALTRRELFLALGRDIYGHDGVLQPNPNKKWRDINPNFPDTAILVYGPPPTSGTRDAFAELVLEKGCARFSQMKALKKSDKKKYKAVCHSVREDGAYIEVGENDNIIIQKLASNPDTLGIFGFSFLDENRDKVRGFAVEGQLPEFNAIANGDYSVSRPLFFYAKLQHYGKTEELQNFVEFFIQPEVMGDDGFLTERGLIPLSPDEYQAIVKAVKEQTPMESL